MRLPGGQHLTYCTNVHPGESWAETFAALAAHVPEIRRRVCPDAPFGIGLRLSAAAARELQQPQNFASFRAWLDAAGCYVFTLNGFPYGAFHGTRVKEAVFEPDWSSPARESYTRHLALLLARLLPSGVDGSISTLPLGYRRAFAGPGGKARLAACAAVLARQATFLADLEAARGCLLRLGLEPEPDGAIETIAEFIGYFEAALIPAARRWAGTLGEDCLRRHVGLCVDACHMSVVGEAGEALLAAARAGVAITKLQVSAALQADWDGDDGETLRQRLAGLADPVYLHQVRGEGFAAPDLPPALAASPRGRWRIHFHVPVHRPSLAGLASTHADTARLLALCVAGGHCRHLEIETYTWDVLPDSVGGGLHDSIAREFRWTLDLLGA